MASDEFDELKNITSKFYIIDRVFIKRCYRERIKEFVESQPNRFTESKFINMCVEKFFDREDAKAAGVSPTTSKKINAVFDMSKEILKRDIIISNLIGKLTNLSNDEKARIISESEAIANENLNNIFSKNKLSDLDLD